MTETTEALSTPEPTPTQGYFRMAWRNKGTILLVTLACVLSVAAWVFTRPRTYKATSTLFVMPERALGGAEGMGLLRDTSQIEYVRALLDSASLQLAVASEMGLEKSDVFWGNVTERNRDALLKRLDDLIDVHEKAGLVQIVAETTKPSLSKDLANAYLDRLTRLLEEANVEKKATLARQVEEGRRELRVAEAALARFLRTTRLPVEGDATSLELKAFLDLNKDLAAAESNLKGVQEQLGAGGNLETQVQLAAQKASLTAQVRVLRKFVQERQSRVDAIPDAALKYLQLSRDLKIKEKVYGLLNEQYYSARSQEVEKKIPYKVVDRALLPVAPASRGAVLKLALASITGFFLAMFLVSLRGTVSGPRVSPVEEQGRP